MNEKRYFRFIVWLAVLAVGCAACASTQPLPQPRKVADPSTIESAVHAPGWDIAAVGYTNMGSGLDYSKAGLNPVFLVFKNKGKDSPSVAAGEARGVGEAGEYLPYSVDEASRLVFSSETFSVTASKAAKTGALGAVFGAGLGALVGAIGGGDNIWTGAAIGAAAGALAGSAVSLYDAEEDLQRAVKGELGQYAWTDTPVPAEYTKVGYLYFPGKVGLKSVKIVVRSGEQLQSYDIPLAEFPKNKEAQQ